MTNVWNTEEFGALFLRSSVPVKRGYYTPDELNYIQQEMALAIEKAVRNAVTEVEVRRNAKKGIRETEQAEARAEGSRAEIEGKAAVARSFGEPGIPWDASDETRTQAPRTQAQAGGGVFISPGRGLYDCNVNPCKLHGGA